MTTTTEALRLCLDALRHATFDRRHNGTGDQESCLCRWCNAGRAIRAAQAALSAAPPVPPLNQCDGCRAGRPIDAEGYHRMSDGEYPDLMACQRERYEPPAPDLDAIELRALLATSEADEDNGSYSCRRCREWFYLNDGSEPGPLCDHCAQALLVEIGNDAGTMAAELRRLRARERAVAEDATTRGAGVEPVRERGSDALAMRERIVALIIDKADKLRASVKTTDALSAIEKARSGASVLRKLAQEVRRLPCEARALDAQQGTGEETCTRCGNAPAQVNDGADHMGPAVCTGCWIASPTGQGE